MAFGKLLKSWLILVFLIEALMKELLPLTLDLLEGILLDMSVSPELRIEAAFLILGKYCEENEKTKIS